MRKSQTNLPVSQTNLAGDLLLHLGQAADGPLHERVKRALRMAIRDGRIEVGTALPPSRQLAADLGCSRWAVTEAYGQLVAEGYLEARTGSATRVRWSNSSDDGSAQRAPLHPAVARFDLAPGLPDLRAFPRRRWADAVRAQVTTVAFTELGYPPPGGHLRLRRLLAEYLARSRGVSTVPQDVSVCPSVSDGVSARPCTLAASPPSESRNRAGRGCAR
jgi:GntR family transcriptional regulator/MocR family aminotransferase